jgi:phosphatidylglycerophosphate synthase
VDSLLLIVPPAPGSGARVLPDTVVAGLPLLRRIVLAGIRAGFSRVLVQSDPAGIDRLLGGTAATALSDDVRLALDTRRRIVILPANVVPQPRWLRALRESEIEAERLYADASLTAVIDTDDSAAVLAAAMRCRGAGELVEGLRARFDWTDLKADDAGRFPLTGPSDTGPAETWLLRSLIKQREGFMSRHFERKISLALTRRLAATRVTPDAMTLVSLAIGLLGASFFLSSSPAAQLAGALLFLTHSILDGCDGELARLKFMESPHGAILDFWGDNLVHIAVFACMAVGLSVTREATWPLALGALTVVATLGAAALASRQVMRDTAVGVDATWAARLAEAFSSRDFIYLVVVLSAFGQAHWCLILASVGTPIFFLLLLSIGARRRA